MNYDLNGNMSDFERCNGDELYKYVYEFDGNRIVSGKNCPGIRNGAVVAYDETIANYDCTYDVMGNLTTDGDNSIVLSYNLLNLPQKITPPESHLQADMPFLTKYRYLWNGEKISAVDSQGDGYLYMGSVRYALSDAGAEFESLPFSMGRIQADGNGYSARYFLTDHLGSVRVITDAEGTVIAEYDYMPYGMQHKNSSLATSDDNDFRYNGKELQERFGFSLYDSQARLQRTDGRFNSIDPLSEEFPSIIMKTKISAKYEGCISLCILWCMFICISCDSSYKSVDISKDMTGAFTHYAQETDTIVIKSISLYRSDKRTYTQYAHSEIGIDYELLFRNRSRDTIVLSLYDSTTSSYDIYALYNQDTVGRFASWGKDRYIIAPGQSATVLVSNNGVMG